MQLNTIYEPIQEDSAKVENELRLLSKVDSSRLAELLDYSLGNGGKGIRPALTLLSGKFYNYNLNTLLPMATAVELLHVATLVHDDRAVLLGNYLFAKAGELTATTQNLRAIKLFAQTLRIISTGELAQTFNAFELEQTYEEYIQRISYKTATLFILATESGAVLSEAPEASIKILNEYGYNLGIAFQIVDDILDFVGSEEELGKPIGSDLAQGTLTLPAMLLLERYPEDNPVKRLFHNRNEWQNIKLAIEIVRNSPIVDECYKVASDYCAKACQNLTLLPENASRRALFELADYIIKRNR